MNLAGRETKQSNMSHPPAPPHGDPRAFGDLGDLDYDMTLASPLSPPLPIPPPPSRTYTDELIKKSMPVDPTPVIRLLAPTPENASPKILLRPRRDGFVDDDDEEPFPDFFYPTPNSTTTSPSLLPSGRYSPSANSQKKYSAFQDPLPWTDELMRQHRRHRRPTFGQSVFEEDTSSSSSSSDESSSDPSGPKSTPSPRDHAQDTGTAGSGPQTMPVSSSSVPTTATTARTTGAGIGAEDKTDEDSRDTGCSGSTAAVDLTAFRFPGAAAGQRCLD